MAIFNKAYIDKILIESSKERKNKVIRSTAKSFNFKPDKPGSSIGTIESEGKKYRANIKGDITEAKSGSADSIINIGKEIYRLKGSHNGERRKAAIQHEIGHQNLHNANIDNKTVDAKNRSQQQFRRSTDRSIKDKYKLDMSKDEDVNPIAHKFFGKASTRINRIIDSNSPERNRELIYKAGMKEDEYLKNTSDEDQKRRDEDYQKAKKYDKSNISPHTMPEEFEADRYAANRTSERAVKKSLANTKKHSDKYKNDKEKEESRIDYAQRSKALKDDDLRKAKTYK